MYGDLRTFVVEANILTHHEWVVNARTPEAAMAEAEEQIKEGEFGDVESREVLDMDAYLEEKE